MKNKVIRQDIYEVMKEAVIDGLNKIREIESKGEYISHYHDFPKMVVSDAGFPELLTRDDKDAPKDYKSVFTGDISNIFSSWRKFWDLSIQDDYLWNFWGIRDEDVSTPDNHPIMIKASRNSAVYGSIENLIDRYIHVSGEKILCEEKFLPIYKEWENAIFLDNLTFDIYTPILCQTFSLDRFEIIPGISIVRMEDDLQLARKGRWGFAGELVHDSVIGAATHALILQGWSTKNETKEKRNVPFYELIAFSRAIEKIDTFFAAMRTETGIGTGYGQIISCPTGWADSWDAFLPPIYVVTTKKYPDYFENYKWLCQAQPIGKDVCEKISLLFEKFNDIRKNNIKIAIKRLNSAYLRNDEADSILDITIALEALLVGESLSEITHKLALRIAALSKIEKFRNLLPEAVYKISKKIYDYRSKVIHGSDKTQKNKMIKIPEKVEIPTVEMGLDLLRFVIRTVSLHPKYLEPEEIDKELFK